MSGSWPGEAFHKGQDAVPGVRCLLALGEEWQTGAVTAAPDLVGKATGSLCPLCCQLPVEAQVMAHAEDTSEHPEPCPKQEKAKEKHVQALVQQYLTVFTQRPICGRSSTWSVE